MLKDKRRRIETNRLVFFISFRNERVRLMIFFLGKSYKLGKLRVWDRRVKLNENMGRFVLPFCSRISCYISFGYFYEHA